MRLRDLQQILDQFTNGQKGTMISDCPVYIETMSGHLEDAPNEYVFSELFFNQSNINRRGDVT